MTDTPNETEIVKIYSLYKRSRDVIDERTYFTLRVSAREQSESRRREAEMAEIMQIARSSGKLADDKETDARSNLPGLLPALLKMKRRFADMVLVSPFAASAMAVGCASLLALILWLPQSPQRVQGNDYLAQVLIENADYVEQLLAQSQDWQYGFSSATKPSSMAFQAGELIIDLRHLCPYSEACLSETLAQRVRAHPPYIDSANELDMQSPSAIGEIEDTLKGIYSEHQNDQQMLLFGQWLEYHYLLAGLSLVQGQTEIFSDNYQHQAALMDWFAQVSLRSGLLRDDEISTLKTAPGSDLNLQSLSQFSTLLIKIRSLLLYA